MKARASTLALSSAAVCAMMIVALRPRSSRLVAHLVVIRGRVTERLKVAAC